MKKVLWVLGAFFIVALVALVSIPLFVDVDQYRPQIQAEANKKINGELELGKLKLSLWGAIKIHAESIKLSVKGFPEPMVVTDAFHLEIPFGSVLAGSPKVVAVLKSPKIRLVKEADGRMNALELMKVAAPQASLPQEGVQASRGVDELVLVDSSAEKEKSGQSSDDSKPQANAGGGTPQAAGGGSAPKPDQNPNEPVAGAAKDSDQPPSEPTKVPALLAGATLGLRVEQGDLHYLDKASKSDYKVNGLELNAQNLGLGSEMKVNVKAPLEGKMPSLTFSGPVLLQAEITPMLVGQRVKSAKGKVELDATQLSLEAPGKFKKPAAMPLTFKADFDGNEKETLLRSADLLLNEYKLHTKGRITADPVTVKMEVVGDSLRLNQAAEFLPLLAAYQLKGLLGFNANVEMNPEALKVNGDLKVSEGSFFVKDTFRAPLEFVVQAGFSENSLNLARAALSGPETEVQLVGSVKNFLAPQFAFSLTGKSFNLDKVLAEPKAAKAAWLTLIPEAVAKEKAEMSPLADLAKNPVVSKASGNFSAKIGKVTAYQSVLENVQLKADLKALQLKVSDASFKTFGGGVKALGDFDLKSPALPYSTRGSVDGISGKEAFSTYFPKFQNTLEGTINADWNVSGLAFPESLRLKSLKGKAKIRAVDGALKSVDFQDSINSAMSKVPFLKDKKPVKIDDGFKSLSADLVFANGVIRAEPIEVQPRNKGFVVKGKSTIQANLEQESFFDVYDPQGQLPRDIQQPGKPALALRLYGPITAPKTDFEYTVKKLAANAGKNAAKNVAGKALEKFLGGSKEGEGKGDPLKDAADKLKKKFKLF